MGNFPTGKEGKFLGEEWNKNISSEGRKGSGSTQERPTEIQRKGMGILKEYKYYPPLWDEGEDFQDGLGWSQGQSLALTRDVALGCLVDIPVTRPGGNLWDALTSSLRLDKLALIGANSEMRQEPKSDLTENFTGEQGKEWRNRRIRD